MAKHYLGYQPQDYATDYARFYDETIRELPADLEKALAKSPFPAGTLPPFSQAGYLQNSGYTQLENSYTIEADGAIHAAILTRMPGVTPAMWDWWFGWHGCRDSRYKLWHPQSHLSARWEDGRDEQAYIGRNSIIEEYIGTLFTPGAIQFKSPTEFGFSYAAIKDPAVAVYTALCRRAAG